MKYFLSTLFLLLSIVLNAQNISVTDFHLDEMDQTANLQGTTVIDQNGEKCALIKIKTTQTGFNFDAGSLGVTKTLQKTAEIWVYVPHGVRKLNISHQKFGQLDYQLPVTTQKAKTYVMDLKAETPLPVDHQRLTIKCQPKNAVVMIDGEMVNLTDGLGDVILKLGSHKYQAMANDYYQTEGSIELKADRPGKLTIELDYKENITSKNSTTSDEEENSNTNSEVIDPLMSLATNMTSNNVVLGQTTFPQIKEIYPGKEKYFKKNNMVAWTATNGLTFFFSMDSQHKVVAILLSKGRVRLFPTGIPDLKFTSSANEWNQWSSSNGLKKEEGKESVILVKLTDYRYESKTCVTRMAFLGNPDKENTLLVFAISLKDWAEQIPFYQ